MKKQRNKGRIERKRETEIIFIFTLNLQEKRVERKKNHKATCVVHFRPKLEQKHGREK